MTQPELRSEQLMLDDLLRAQSLLDAAQIEERILFSAVPLVLDGAGANNQGAIELDQLATHQLDAAMVELGLHAADNPDALTSDHSSIDLAAEEDSAAVVESTNLLRQASEAVDLSGVSRESSSQVKHIVFVQSGLEMDDLSALALEQTRIVLLDAHQNGFEQVSRVLEQYSDLASIQFVTHGADGFIQLGNSWLTASNISQHASELQRWGLSLSEHGDILVYGCDVAQTSDGQAFIDTLSRLTSADVAASTDATGESLLAAIGRWSTAKG